MPLKKIALLTILLLLPSFVCFIMCPFAHSFTASKSQQLLVMQKLQKNIFEQKEFTSAPLFHTSLLPFNLHDKVIVQFLHPSIDRMPSNQLTQLQTTRLNI